MPISVDTAPDAAAILARVRALLNKPGHITRAALLAALNHGR